MKKQQIQLLIIWLLGIQYLCIAQFTNKLYLTEGETKTISLDDYFSGYNVSYQLEGAPQQCEITPKFKISPSITEFQKPINWISWWIEKDDEGSWYKDIVLLDSEKNLHIGTIENPSSVPKLEEPFNFEKDQNILCFDVEKVQKDIYYIDCSQIDPENRYVNNYFYVVNSKNKETKRIPNLNVTSFNYPFKRRILYAENGSIKYLFRYSQQYSLPSQYANDTSVEIFILNNENEVEPLDVIDRTILGVKKLFIETISYLEGELYILDHKSGIFRVQLLGGNKYNISQFNVGHELNNMTVYKEIVNGIAKITVLVANHHNIYEIDWTQKQSPFQKYTYDLNLTSLTQKIDLSRNYVIVQTYKNVVSSQVAETDEYFIRIYRRNHKSADFIYYVIDTLDLSKDDTVHFEFNIITENLFIIDKSKIMNAQISKSILECQIPDKLHEQNLKSTHQFSLVINENKKNIVKLINKQNITLNLLSKSDTKIYQLTNNNLDNYLLLNYPGTFDFNIANHFSGPAIQYITQNTSNINAKVLKYEEIEFNYTLPTDIKDLTQIIHSQFQTYFYPDSNSKDYLWFIQDTNYILHVQKCSNINKQDTINCKLAYKIQLQGQIMILRMSNNYIAIKTQADVKQIMVYNPATGEVYATQIFGDVREECLDLDILATISGEDLILCTQPQLSNIKFLSVDIPTKQLVVQQDLQKNDLGISDFFKPEMVYTNIKYPNTLFVVDNNKLIRIIHAGSSDGNQPTIISNYSSNILEGINPLFDLAVVDQNLIIISYNTNQIEEVDIQILYKPKKTKQFPTNTFQIVNGKYDYSPYTNFLFTLNKHQDEYYVYIYSCGKNYHDVLYQVIPWKTENPNQILFIQTFTPFFNNEDYLILHDNLQLKAYKFNKDPILTLSSPHNPTQDPFPTQQLELTVKNQLITKNEFKVQYNIVQKDTQSVITKTQGIQNIVYQIQKNQIPYTTQINMTNHLNGAVFEYSLNDCMNNECNDGGIKVNQRVEYNGSLLNLGLQKPIIRDIYSKNNNQYILLNQELYILEGTQVIDYLDLKSYLTSDSQCQKITSDELLTYLVVICRNTQTKDSKILFIQQIQSTPTVFDSEYLPNIYNINKIVILDQYLFLLNSDPDSPETQDAVLYIYFLNFERSQGLPQFMQCQDPITSEDFGLQSYIITHFDIVKINEFNQYKLILVDQNRGLLVLDFEIDQFNIKPQYSFVKNILKSIPVKEQAILVDLKYSGVAILGIQSLNNNNNNIITNILVTTQNFHHYQVQIIQENNIKIKVNIIAVHMRYSNLRIINRLKHNQNYFLVVGKSSNYDSDSKDIYLIYQIHQVNTDAIPKNYTYPTLLSIGGVQQETPLKIDVQHYQYDISQSQHTFIYDEFNQDLLRIYQLNSHPLLTIHNKDINTKQFKIQAKNTLSSIQIEALLDIQEPGPGPKPPTPEPGQDQKHKVSIVIVILVVVSIMVLGCLIYFLGQKKKKSEVESDDSLDSSLEKPILAEP